jgi:hypothetical protein
MMMTMMTVTTTTTMTTMTVTTTTMTMTTTMTVTVTVTMTTMMRRKRMGEEEEKKRRKRMRILFLTSYPRGENDKFSELGCGADEPLQTGAKEDGRCYFLSHLLSILISFSAWSSHERARDGEGVEFGA